MKGLLKFTIIVGLVLAGMIHLGSKKDQAEAAPDSITPASSYTADFDIIVDNFTSAKGMSEVVLKVTNNTHQTVKRLFINCVFMDENKRAIDIGRALISDFAPAATTYEEAGIAQSAGVQFVACQVHQVTLP